MKYDGTCVLRINDENNVTVIEKTTNDGRHTGAWNVTQAILAAVRAFDAANPPGVGESSLADRIRDGLKNEVLS